MSNIDRFESAFKAAARTPFQYQQRQLDNVLVVSDLESVGADSFLNGLKGWLSHCTHEQTQWTKLGAGQSNDIGTLMSGVDHILPDLICTHRRLHQDGPHIPGLAHHVIALTQHTLSPVLLLPEATVPSNPIKTVIAMTDHLAGDHRLVNGAAHFSPDGAVLWLSDIEDEITFERYMDVIAKIPDLNTDVARESILNQLFKDAKDYGDSCITVLHEQRPQLEVKSEVTLGHHLREYKSLVEQHQVDLLVMNTKDEDQLAMHGLAYPLAVELVDTPILML